MLTLWNPEISDSTKLFRQLDKEEVKSEILSLDSFKTPGSYDIPIKMVKYLSRPISSTLWLD